MFTRIRQTYRLAYVHKTRNYWMNQERELRRTFSRYFVATQGEILGAVYCWYRGRNR